MKTETLKSQVKRLAEFIMQECKGYPNQSEGAIDCAIRIIKDLKEFASLNPERVREVLQDHSTFNAKISSKSFIIDDEFDSIISDLCSGSQDETDKIIKDLSGEKILDIKIITSTDYGQEKEQAKNECEHNNTEIQDLRCNVCLDCGKIIEMID